MSAVAGPATDEEAKARLAEKLAEALAAAREAGDEQTIADLERLPTIVEELDRKERQLRADYEPLDEILVRLSAPAERRSAPVPQAVIGFAAGRSKNFVGYRLGQVKKRTGP